MKLQTVTIITSGHNSIDKLLGGGIRSGLITDIFGDSKLASNTITLAACVAAARTFQNSSVIYIDTIGNFRPELIFQQLHGSPDYGKILNKIIFVRLNSSVLLKSTIRKALIHQPKMIVIDSFVTLFTNEFKGITRHLSIMHHLHDLAVISLNFDVAIVITNPSVYQTKDYDYHKKSNLQSISDSYVISKREVLGSTLGIYTHTVLQIERSQLEETVYYLRLVKPYKPDKFCARIINGHIEDL